MLTKIISGGQTGADQGALHGARLSGIATGGTAPKGWQTELGPQPELLKRYNLCQSQKSGYAARTFENVMNSDCTLIFGDPNSSGSALTAKYCRYLLLTKPYLKVIWRTSGIELDTIQHAANWVKDHDIYTLNVAGNRESKNRGIYVATSDFIVALVEELRKD